MRGEYSMQRLCANRGMGSPPLARGIRLATNADTATARITPACAGNTFLDLLIHFLWQDHPRLRGEYSFGVNRSRLSPGSPPLARGIRDKVLQEATSVGITPACAGNTFLVLHTAVTLQDHPRLRGEYWKANPWVWVIEGSPPLARGILES